MPSQEQIDLKTPAAFNNALIQINVNLCEIPGAHKIAGMEGKRSLSQTEEYLVC